MQSDGKPKILIVDDDEDSAVLVMRMLQLHDLNAVVVNDSTMALKAVDDERPDLVLLDLIMPRIGGAEILLSLREKYSRVELPVVMLTAMDDSSSMANCFSLGANDYLAKPIDSVVAIARISTQLAVSQLYRENLAKKELETLNAMIVTYNHEINNPLSAAMLGLPSDVKNVSQESIDELRASLERIAGIVKKIEHLAHKSVHMDRYSDNTRIVRL
ncbi:MAG: hypothetical protein A2283_15185 [Lentisphaerae bacterium RIFOXYA12_FULL_48_11]|nr:MAG: hypothetical protein A2283_15185 [Lentisphaerae bacterium RIFOXYA12_FULL_48_11]